MLTIDFEKRIKEVEEKYDFCDFSVRFNNLDNATKYDFIKAMKNGSSIRSIKNIKEKVNELNILKALTASNPMILSARKFHSNQFPRWKEKNISQIIYRMLCCKNTPKNLAKLEADFEHH